ncbi:tumor protein D54-like [Scleropages formosus]|uniref:TPD52 like 2 n=1 Tax=Scleropages formosus TaxID=113540 RepID=A0A0P7TH17_SCLFO|nr:tumor protein D54 isoform X2 [Scleropages formosus]KPP60130.1 tumor protein D54-like [Scleropages formosus]
MESAGQDINLNSPSKGLIMGTSLSDSPAGAAGVATPCALSGLSQEEHEELTLELSKVEEEIHTLRQVLAAKEKHAGDLKRRLGLTPLEELKQNLTRSWHDVQASSAYVKTTEKLGEWNDRLTTSDLYKKTQETLTQASQRTSAALSTVGTVISRKFGDMRNSPTFRSFEDKVGSMKYKVVGGVSDEGLRSPSEQSHP